MPRCGHQGGGGDMSITVVKNALHAWFADATGLPVIWSNQNAPIPTGAYGTLLVSPSRELGAGETTFTYDDVAAWTHTTAYLVDARVKNAGNIYTCTTAGTSAGSGGPTGTGLTIADGSAVWAYERALGSDMIPRTVIHSVITVSCQVHVPEPSQGTAWTHDTRALVYIEKARATLRMPKPLAALRAANIAHVRSEPSQDLSGVWGGTWRDRAAFDVHFATSQTITDTGESLIETVEIEGDIDGNTFTDTIGA